MRVRMLWCLLFVATLVQTGWTESCPKNCICDKADRAECISWDIEPFPSDTHITTLKLSRVPGDITLSAEKFKELRLESLETLVLDHVQIDEIDPSAFSEGHIRVLQITNSAIPKLDYSTFADSRYITQVYIEKSHIGRFKGLESSTIKGLALVDCGLKDIPQKAFLRLDSLEWLNLEHNSIEHFDNVELPFELNLTLAYNRIRSLHVTKNLLSSLSSLHLSHNPLENLTIVEDVNLGLDQLYLDSTVLNNLDFLKNTSELSILSLKNAIHFPMAEDVFGNLEKLLNLDISSNGLSELPQNLFKNNTKLSTLIMDDNNFKELPVFYFSASQKDERPNIKLLKFSCNDCRLMKLDKRSFNFINICERIELRNNKLQELPEELFENVAVTHLDLSHNRIQKLPERIFKNNNQLKTLILSNNRLHQLATDVFQNCYQLIELQLNNCALDVLWDSASAKHLQSLQRLYVEGNKIFEITREQLAWTPNLEVLSLLNNPLKCNWQYLELRHRIKETLRGYLDPLKDSCLDKDQIIELVDDPASEETEEVLTPSDEDNNLFLTDAKDVLTIESERFNKDMQEDELRRDLVLYLLPTFIFVLTAMVVLLVIVSVALCILHKRRQNQRARVFDNRFWIPKKHSGTVYRPLSEEKTAVFM